MEILLVDAPGGPQPEELAEILAGFAPVRTIMVPWGGSALRERRLRALSRLGPVELVARPDQVIEAGLASAATHGCRAVLALSEIVSFYAGLLADLLGLPGNPPQSLMAVRSKARQRDLLARAGVPSPAVRQIAGPEDLDACSALRFPVILKPSTGVGSLCVCRVDRPADLPAAYSEAIRRYDADPRPNGAVPLFLAEEEIQGANWHKDPRFGNQVSVESVLHEGESHHLGVTDKLPLAPPFREVGHVTPTSLADADAGRIEDVAGSAIRALGLTTGLVHTELMLTQHGPVVLEVNGRLGGGVYELMWYSRSYDVVSAAVATACGQAPALPGAAARYTAFVKPQPAEGRRRVAAVDEAAFREAMRPAQWGVLDKTPGAVLDSENGTNGNLARFLTTAGSLGALFENIDAIDAAVRAAVTVEAAG